MTLSRDQILSVTDIKVVKLNLPEWGGDVYVKGMTGKQRDTFENLFISMKGTNAEVNLKDVRATLVSMTLCDEKGVPLFTKDDIPALSEKSASALEKVFNLAQKLSGLVPDDIKSLVKN